MTVDAQSASFSTLRIVHEVAGPLSHSFQVGSIHVNLSAQELTRGAQRIALSSQEAEILRLLWEADGAPVSRQTLYQEVWGYRTVPRGRAADFAILRLRQKLEDDPSSPLYLQTLRGVGFRLVGCSAAAAPPAAPSHAPSRRHNLPRPLSRFFGRAQTLASLQASFAHPRDGVTLVTILGPGGMGKTRVSLQAGRAIAESDTWPGGVWFCDLVGCTTAGDIERVVMEALGLSLDAPSGLGAQLAARPPALLILDNCETAISTICSLMMQWLPMLSCGGFLLTSRQRLGLPGEQLLPLPQLPAAAAHQMLCDRAVRLRPSLRRGDLEASLQPLIAPLEGLPLAIELAAGRLRILSPQQLAARLDRPLDILSSRDPAHPKRQSTLRQTIADSWALLSQSAQHALQQCTVFRASFSLAAAEEVLDELDAIEEVMVLVDSSLLSMDESDMGPRFQLPKSIRDFILEQDVPDRSRSEAADRYLRWLAKLGQRESRSEIGAATPLTQRMLGHLMPDLLACIERGLQTHQLEEAAAVAMLVFKRITITGPMHEGLSLAQRLLAYDGLSDTSRLDLEHFKALALKSLGQPQEALTLLQRLQVEHGEDQHGQIFVEQGLGSLLRSMGQSDRAREHLARALVLARALHQRGLQGQILSEQGMLEIRCDNLDRADEALAEALLIQQERGDEVSQCSVLGNQATASNARGNRRRAAAQIEAAIELARRVGHRRTEGVLCGNLGLLAMADGRLEDAWQLHRKGLRIHEETGDQIMQALTLSNLALVEHQRGNHDQAQALYDALLEDEQSADRNPMLRIITSGNYAALLLDLGELAAAQAAAAQAIAGASKVGFTIAEGLFSTLLARVEARLPDDARGTTAPLSLAQRGVDLLRQTHDPVELARGLAFLTMTAAQLGASAEQHAAHEQFITALQQIPGGPPFELEQLRTRLEELPN